MNLIFNEKYLADRALEYVLKEDKRRGTKDRAFIAEHVYTLVRHWRLLRHCAQLPHQDTQAHFSDGEIWRTMAVLLNWEGYSVQQFRETAEAAHYPLPTESDLEAMPLALRYSLPDWLFEYLKTELSIEQLKNELWAQTQQAPLFVRANTLKTTALELKKYFTELNIPCSLVGESYPDALRIHSRTNIMATGAFKNGFFEVQDLSSQTVAPLLSPQPHERVLDACAGAGGKTLHLAAIMQNTGKIIALDTESKRLKELERRMLRGGIENVEIRTIDSSKTIKRLEGSMDAVLLDVPCSGLGVLRRNPDAKWRLTPNRIQDLKNTQSQILRDLHKTLKPHGRLLYATCSILPSENAIQVKTFLDQNPQFELVAESQLFTQADSGDGFYKALLQKI